MDLALNNLQRLICHKPKQPTNQHLVNFAGPVERSVKVKEVEMLDNYQDFESKLNKLWNLKVTVIPNIIGALGILS